MIRSILLTVLLILLGVLATIPLGLPRLLSLDPEIQRRAVLWGLPLAAMLLSFVLFPRLLRPAEVAPGPPARRLVLLAACGVALLVDQSFLLVGRLTGWATFTAAPEPPGHRLASIVATAAWALPACLFLAIWGSERALRGAVYTGWRRRLPAPAALAVSILTGALLTLPLILPRAEVPDAAFVAGTLIAVLCRELSFALLFRGGGGLLVAGLYRGVLLFVEAFLVTDWFGLFFPAFNYVTGGPLFYGVRAACALVAAGVIAWVVQPAPGLSLRRVRPVEDFDPAEEPEAG
jgi:hypothetical protein